MHRLRTARLHGGAHRLQTGKRFSPGTKGKGVAEGRVRLDPEPRADGGFAVTGEAIGLHPFQERLIQSQREGLVHLPAFGFPGKHDKPAAFGGFPDVAGLGIDPAQSSDKFAAGPAL